MSLEIGGVLRCVLAGAVAVGLLTACGGGAKSTDSAEPKESRAASGRPPSPSPSPTRVAPKTQLSVPSLYDTSQGWESDLPGTQLALPHSEAVAVFRQGGRNNGDFTVLDVTSGEILWKSATVEGFGSMSPLSVTVQGQDYLIASASGAKGAGTVSKGREVTTIDIFSARGSGDAVKPARHLELEGEGVVRDGGGGLLVELDDDVVMTVDPATGAMTKYDLDELEPPADECTLCLGKTKAVAVTSRGPLLTVDSHSWVPKAWSSGGLTTNSENTVFVGLIAEDALVAKWHDEGATDDTWAVLDSATGKVLAKVDCESPHGIVDDDAEGAALSAAGRYLVRSHTVFDLEKGTGHCFEETDQDKPIHLTGVTDDGVAFGSVALDGNGSKASVVIDVATGEAKDSEHGAVPFSDYAGYGLFWDDSANTMVAYPHAK
ncbi:hypothetical protein OHA77_21845 [Streptosporangium sp. NBC_01639]|uniref:hypothetical protein n=1 Tax=Streptosporangium sp. NBC_01639 TaxID=2975948 RepID=UPI00386D1C81|nr:hypothetical protein OHA77_21845 [Streptosporangium sp. NBC_01639]